MSEIITTNSVLVMDLPMDEIRNEAITNLAQGSLRSPITTTGVPHVVYDYYMGSSISFQGAEFFRMDDVKITTERGASLEFWFNMNECRDQDNTLQQLIYLRNNATGEGWGIHAKCEVQGLFLSQFKESNATFTLINKITCNKWIHFALCADKQGIKTYINGVLVNELSDREFSRFLDGDNRFLIQIGARETKDFFYGKMCQLKICSGVRSEDELKLSMEEGRSANASFKSSYPIDFKLNSVDNGSENPVLYIENNTNGHPLKLDMINTSGTAIKFAGGPVKDFALSENDYHIQLRFKKQVVADEVLAGLTKITGTEINGWGCMAGKNTTLLEDWISFKRLPANTDETFTGLQSIILSNMRAEAMAGARNTLVEIKYNNLYYKDSQSVLNGSLTRHLDIIGHLGKRNVPFDVSIKGASTILNDGESKNSFDIIIRNMTGEPVKFAAATAGAVQYSKFTLYSKEPITFKERPGIRFTDNKFEEDISTKDKHLPRTFLCRQQNQVLNADNDQLRIEVTGLITSYASGTLILYLEYKNIPGYWDGVIPVAVQLGRIVERDNKIGVNMLPAQELHVKGNIKSETRILDRTGYVMPVGAIIAYGGSAAPDGWLLCDGKTDLQNDKYAELRSVLQQNKTPDLRSQFIVGAGTDAGNYKVGDRGGTETVVLEEKHIPRHKHTGTTANENVIREEGYKLMGRGTYKRDLAGGVKSTGAFTSLELNYYCAYDSACEEPAKIENCIKREHAHSFSTAESGGGQAHENRPPYYALTYIIKY